MFFEPVRASEPLRASELPICLPPFPLRTCPRRTGYFMATVKETFLLTALGSLCSAICGVALGIAWVMCHP